MTAPQAELTLASGTTFRGTSFGAARAVAGEVVFVTAMTGYVEALTDPSYRGQILVLTYPLAGNYGVPRPRPHGTIDPPYESDRIQVLGLVVQRAVERYSHHDATRSLEAWLVSEGVPAITGVDTRALTMQLRAQGTMQGTLRPGGAPQGEPASLALETIHEGIASAEPRRYDAGPKTVLLVDTGAKDNLVRSLLARGLSVLRVDHHADLATLSRTVSGVVLGSGPGDPKSLGALIQNTRGLLDLPLPIFGVCLGSQILALAAGGDTAKLPYGHRGVNQPVQDLRTRRSYVTSQNHGYAVVDGSLPDGWEPWFVNTNDGTNEGVRSTSRPHFGVQFHPEGSPGPDDTTFLFDDFAKLVHEHART